MQDQKMTQLHQHIPQIDPTGPLELNTILHLLSEIQPLGSWEADTLLFESGYMDSILIFDKLLPALESRFAIEIAPWELVPEHFDTPNAIYRYVKGKKGL